MTTPRMFARSARLAGPLLCTVLLIGGSIAPATVSADTDLVVGGSGVIAYADGDNVRVRSGPSYDDGTNLFIPEGSQVDILDGTFEAADGSLWYEVAADGQQGYVVSDFLAASDGILSATSGSAVTSDAINIRSGPGASNGGVATLGAGETVELTGENANGWLSVRSGDATGYAYGAFLSLAPDAAVDSGPSGTRYTNDSVNLRTGPALDQSVIAELPADTALELTGAQSNGFAEASTEFGAGWVSLQYIGEAASAESGPSGTSSTNDSVNLRTGPALDQSVITELPANTVLELSGAQSNGFAEASTEFGKGWVSLQYVGDASGSGDGEAGLRYTNDSVNLRSAPELGAGVLSVLPLSTSVEFTGVVQNGFAEVASSSGTGWVAAEFLSLNSPAVPDSAAAPPAAEPEVAASRIIWPVQGGEWRISQGYNGSSHQNRSSLWQYQYSFDIVRSDGNTTDQSVYSPVNGTIRWFDESTGGVSIDMGDGLAFSIFHVNYDAGLQEGDQVSQGQYIGAIAGPGGGGNGGFPHLHMSVWETSDGGNWSRSAIPFTGAAAVSGIEFPDTGAGNDHRDYTFNP